MPGPNKFGKCRVIKQLGRGAMAVVYLARHETLDMPVAVKVLPKQLSEQRKDYAPRFLREARTAARLTHPNIVRVIDCGVAHGHYYMVMDYVEGEDCLSVSRHHRGGMDWEWASEVMIHVAEGLQYAASHGVTHRDVKPANIMIDKEGRALITDLGLAKITMKGAAELTGELRTVGTPNYMSPEQIRNPGGTDHRADIYSLGATFYRLVCGRAPFKGRTPMDVVAMQLTEPLVPPIERKATLPIGLSAIICRMMAKSADERYQDYETFLDDMRDLLAGNEVSALGFQDTPIIQDEEELKQVLGELDFLADLEIELEDEPSGPVYKEGTGGGASASVELFTSARTSVQADSDVAMPQTDDEQEAEEFPSAEDESESFALPAKAEKKPFTARAFEYCRRHRRAALVLFLLALGSSLWMWLASRDPETQALAELILDAEDGQPGLCVHLGCGEGELVCEIGRQDGRFVVQGLSPDQRKVDRARRRLREAGLSGSVSVARSPLKVLPYADNTVNVLVAHDVAELFAGGLRPAEVMRVLCPGGRALLNIGAMTREELRGKLKEHAPEEMEVFRLESRWAQLVKPWPAQMDQWPQYRLSAARTAVSQDSLVGPPQSLRWMAGDERLPPWASGGRVRFVSAGGRNFYFIGRGPGAGHEHVDRLVARDAFNGVTLWEREIQAELESQLMPYRLAADEERVYTYLESPDALVALHAATGAKAMTYSGIRRSAVTIADGAIVVGPGATAAWHARSGRRLWKDGPRGKDPCVVADGRVFVLSPGSRTQLICLDLTTGERRWQVPANGEELLCWGDGLIFTGQSQDKGYALIHAYSARDGKAAWPRPYRYRRPHAEAPPAVFVAHGQVWTHQGNPDKPGTQLAWVALDLKTGRQRAAFPSRSRMAQPDEETRATLRFLLAGSMDFFGFPQEGSKGRYCAFHGGSGTPGFGYLPANGLVYQGPNGLMLFPQIGGFAAFAADVSPGVSQSDAAVARRLRKGPAFADRITAPPEDQGGWATFRHDPMRSGGTTAKVGRRLRKLWETGIGSGVTSPVATGGKVFAAACEEHRVVALDAGSGRTLWEFAAEGRVDSPPTVAAGRVLFGSADGWVYCLRESDGELIWRFRAAPRERQIVVRGQLQSVWPVPGSVLVAAGTAYFAAGTHCELDGGIMLYAMEPATGKLKWQQQVKRPRDFQQTSLGGIRNCVNSILSTDGRSIAMDAKQFSLSKGEEVRRATGWVVWGGPFGFLTDISRPPYGEEVGKRHWGYVDPRRTLYRHGPYVRGVRATALAVRGDKACGIMNDPARVFGAVSAREKWSTPLPRDYSPKAILLAGDTLFVAAQSTKADDTRTWLLAYSADSGDELGRTHLPIAPKFDGMAATTGRLYVAAADGSIICLAGQ